MQRSRGLGGVGGRVLRVDGGVARLGSKGGQGPGRALLHEVVAWAILLSQASVSGEFPEDLVLGCTHLLAPHAARLFRMWNLLSN